MFLRPEPTDVIAADDAPAAASAADARDDRTARAGAEAAIRIPMPIALAIGLSVFGTLLFGALPPATQVLDLQANTAANLEATGLAAYTLPEEPPAPAAGPTTTPGPTTAAASR